jgi:hypothetical protein
MPASQLTAVDAVDAVDGTLGPRRPRDTLCSDPALLCTAAAWAFAIALNAAFASSSGRLGLLCGLALLEFALEFAWLPGWLEGTDGVRPLILFALEFGAVSPSRGVAVPLARYCVDLESWLRRPPLGSRSKEFWREFAREGA